LSVLFERRDGTVDEGLDLTRATIAACIKYPWARDPDHILRSKKWGYYRSETAYFEWARQEWRDDSKTLDCQIMDIADDVTYSIHDLEDFHRCCVIPWRPLFMEGERAKSRAARLIDNALDIWRIRAGDRLPRDAAAQLLTAHRSLAEIIGNYEDVINRPYDGTRQHRVQTRQLTSTLVATLIGRIGFKKNPRGGHRIDVGDEEQNMLRLLKSVTIDYILSNSSLMAQQQGHGRLLTDLYGDFLRAMVDRDSRRYLPRRFEAIEQDFDDGRVSARRAACDCICSLTEGEAVAIHGRLRGHDAGSVLHPLAR
jgi:dGTPase